MKSPQLSRPFRLRVVLLVICIALVGTAHLADAFTPTIFRASGRLTDDAIKFLAGLSKSKNGTKTVGKLIGKLKLTDDLLEDTYLRIVVEQGHFSADDAHKMSVRLRNVPGFRTTLRKITGNNTSGRIGHIHELKTAHHAAERGFEVVAIGHRFDDGIKRGISDIDLILKKYGKTFAIETKNRKDIQTSQFLATFRNDMETLVQFTSENKSVIPVFSIVQVPSEPYLKLFQDIARRRGVQLVFGSIEAQFHQLAMLGYIL